MRSAQLHDLGCASQFLFIPHMDPKSSSWSPYCFQTHGLLCLLGCCCGSQPIVFVNIDSLPRIADPHVFDGTGSEVAAIRGHIIRQLTLLWLVFVLWHKWGLARRQPRRHILKRLWTTVTNVKDKDGKLGRLCRADAQPGSLDVLLQLANGIV